MENLKNMMGVVVISTEEYSLLCERSAIFESFKRVIDNMYTEEPGKLLYVKELAKALDINWTLKEGK